MKKIFTLAVAVLASISLMAQSYTTLFSTDFSDASWAGHDTICKGTTAEETINGIFFRSADNAKYYTIADGALTFCNNNSGNKYFIAIPVQNVNDSVIVTIGTVDNAQRVSYLFRETNVINPSSISMASTAANINTNKSITIKYEMKTDSTVALVMLGRQGSGFGTVIKSITVSTLSGSVTPPTPSTDSVLTAEISGANECYVGKSVTLTCSAENATTYQWYNTDGIIEGATAQTYVFTPEAEGSYGFYCLASNQYNTNPIRSNSLIVTATIKPAAVACANIIPAASGTNPTEVGTEIDLDVNSEGGKIFVAGMKKTDGTSIVYNALGLGLMTGGADSVRVEFNNYIAEGSVITIKMAAGGTSERGLKLQSVTKSTLLDAKWTPAAAGEEKEFEYTVPAGSPLIGDYRILLARNNSVYLQSVQMADCGAARDIPVDTDPVLKASKAAVDMALTAANPTPSATVTFTGKNLAAGTYNLTIPEVAGLTVNPTSVTVGEDGKLSAEVTIAYTSDVDVVAASANIVLTIGELSATVAVNYSAVLAKNYINASVNIEGLVMANGTGYDIAAAFGAANIEYANINGLDSLNDSKGAARNEAYLGLKLKATGAYIAGWLQAGKTIRVKFGNVGASVKVLANGVTQTFTKEQLATPLEYTATADDYVKIETTSSSTVVIKQIMIDEPIANVMYNIAYNIGEGGTVTGWTVALPGEEVVMDITSNEGYALNNITYNGTAMTQSAPKAPISFIMPAENVTVEAVFGDVATAIDNSDAEVKSVKFFENGQLFIEKNGVIYNAQGAIVK